MPRGFAAAFSWPPSRATALTRPSDHGGVDRHVVAARAEVGDDLVAEALLDRQRPRLEAAGIERRDQVVGVPLGRVDRLPAGRARGRHAGRARAAPTAPAGRRPACRRRATARRRAARARARASFAVACPARATTAVPPRARTSGRACRAASRAPGSSASSAASRRSASPRSCCRTGRRRRGARCRRASARRRRAAGRRSATSAGSRPSPGRSSPLASSPISARRSSAYSRESSRSSGTSRVAVVRVPVGERELRRLGQDVHELGLAERRDVEPLEQPQLLQPGRPLAPRRASCRP